VQVVWTYEWEFCADIPNITTVDARLLMPIDVYTMLVDGNVPLQHTKDIIAAMALGLGVSGQLAPELQTHQATFYADMKMFWLPGRCFTVVSGAAVGLEPVKLTGGRATSRQIKMEGVAGQPWLGFLVCAKPTGQEFFERMADVMLTFWAKRAVQISTGQIPPVDWSENQRLWMHNTQIVYDMLPDSLPSLGVEVLSPRLVCPLPSWARSVEASSAFGYEHPSLGDILAGDEVRAVTCWTSRQGWSEEFMAEVAAACSEVARIGGWAAPPLEDAVLTVCQVQLLPILTPGAYAGVLGRALAFVQIERSRRPRIDETGSAGLAAGFVAASLQKMATQPAEGPWTRTATVLGRMGRLGGAEISRFAEGLVNMFDDPAECAAAKRAYCFSMGLAPPAFPCALPAGRAEHGDMRGRGRGRGRGQ